MDYRVLVGYISEWLGAFSVAWLLSLSPRFKKPTVGFLYARRDGIIALSLYALILVFAFLFYSVARPVFTEPERMSPAPVHDLGQALVVAGLSLIAFVVALLVRRQPVRSIGWNPELLMPALQMGLATGILTIFLHNRVMDVLGNMTPARVNALLFALGIGLAEETIFRGYIQMRLSWWLGTWKGIAITALAFMLWHMPVWLGLPFNTLLILSGLTLVQGLVLGWVMLKTGHAAAPAIYRAMSIWMGFFL